MVASRRALVGSPTTPLLAVGGHPLQPSQVDAESVELHAQLVAATEPMLIMELPPGHEAVRLDVGHHVGRHLRDEYFSGEK